jgi:hypothetical protein
LYYFHKKLKIKKTQKNPKKTFLVVFFRWVILGGFFWVGFLLPTLQQGGHDPSRRRHRLQSGPRESHYG